MIRKILSALILLPVGLVVVVFAVINRQAVTLNFDPLSAEAPVFSLSVPLYMVVFAALLLGILLGGMAAWLRQGRWRKAARRANAEVERLKSDTRELKAAIEKTNAPALPAPARAA